MKKVCITGIFGMDARNLAEILLSKGYEVVGTYRYSSIPLKERIEYSDLNHQIKLVSLDITDMAGVTQLIRKEQFDLFFNLAAQSHVGESFRNPYYAIQVDGIGPLNILEAIRVCSPHTRYYNAGSSEMFGSNYEEVKLEDGTIIREQSESTCLDPNSPYGVGKLMSHNLVRIYREAYGIFAVSGILFNHTDPEYRTPTFFERKVSKYVAELNIFRSSMNRYKVDKNKDIIIDIDSGSSFPLLKLGTIEGVYRDIGWSHDYMRAAYMMTTNTEPKDYVVATGEARPLTEILKIMFGYIGIENFEDFYVVDPEFIRPVDVPYLRGNSSLIQKELGWQPTKSFKELMTDMVWHDIELAKIKYF